MGWLIPKKHFRWTEPKRVHVAKMAHEEKSLSPFYRPMMVLAFMGIMMGQWFYLTTVKPKENQLPTGLFLLISLLAATIAVYLLSWFAHAFRPTYLVSERGITRVGAATWHLAFKEIAHCKIVSQEFSGARCAILAVTSTRKPEPITIGIDESVPLDELSRVFSGHGVTVERILGESSEE